MADRVVISEEVREACVEAVAKIAWAEMTQKGSGLPEYDRLPAGMVAPLKAQVRATLAPVWKILEEGL